jgi:hypothetical protein
LGLKIVDFLEQFFTPNMTTTDGLHLSALANAE